MNNNNSFEVLASLKNNLLQIDYFLKQQQKNYFDLSKNYLYQNNWSLIIGPEKSGKTSLLQQADLNFMQCQAPGGSAGNAWFNNNGVFIELPSLTDNIELAHEFIKSIKQVRRKKAFDSIILTLNIYDYLSHSQSQFMEQLQQLENALAQLLKPHLQQEIKLYIVYTNVDRVAGFGAFFTEFSKKERQQAWGYQLDHYTHQKALTEYHNDKFNALLRNMHEHLISKIHTTRNNLTGYLIREFPLQIESLQQVIKSTVLKISKIDPKLCKVKGVFFTSARQIGTCHDRITASIAKSYELALEANFHQASREQAFFIDGMLNAILENHEKAPQIANWLKPTMVTASAVALGFLIITGINYYFSATALKNVNQELNNFSQQAINDNSHSLKALVPPLAQLVTADNHLSHQYAAWLLPFNQYGHVQNKIDNALHQSLTHDFLPLLAQHIEHIILNAKDPAQRYNSLKAYLMLGEPQHLNLNYLRKYLQDHHFENSLQLLEAAVAPPYSGIPLNHEAINKARANLNTIPLNYLSFVLLKNSVADHIITLNNPHNILKKTQIPYLYTRDGFIEYIRKLLPQQLTQLQRESWVLKRAQLLDKHELFAQVNQLYFVDYINWWQLFIGNMQPMEFTDLSQANEYFKTLAIQASSLSDIIQLIQNNTRAFDHPDATQLLFNQQIAARFTSINLITPNNIHLLMPIFADLTQYFNTLATAADQEQACFNVAKTRFLNPFQDDPLNELLTLSEKSPEPINHWLKSIAQNSWILILQHAQHYINQQWQNTVYNEYQTAIVNRYPLTAASDSEISLDDFRHFFAADGSLQKFFDDYLKPFLNTNESQWQPKEVAGLSLPFNAQTVLELERANVIKQMFFGNNQHMLSLSFSLQPLAFQPTVNAMAFDINGQRHLGERGATQSSQFNWPGDYQNIPATVAMQLISGQKYQLSESGPWGLFKLLGHAKLQPFGSDTRHFEVIFELNGNGAKYLLTANDPVNPFNLQVIQQFTLPQEIT